MDTWWYVNTWFLSIWHFVEMWMFIDLDMRYSAIALSSICLFSWIEKGRLWPFVSFWDKKRERRCSYYFGDWISTWWWLFWILDILRYMLICDLVSFGFEYTLDFLDILVDILCIFNCFTHVLLIVLFVSFNCRHYSTFGEVLSEWVALYESWVGLTCTHSCCKGFCPRIAKGGDYECLARLAILNKIPNCLLTRFTNPSSDYLTFED